MSDVTSQVPKNALFVCFGAMSNVGTLTGLASLEVVRSSEPGQVGIFCLGGLPTQAPTVLDKTRRAGRIVTVDGCPLNCARKVVEQAGFVPAQTVNLVEDGGIAKRSGIDFTPDEMKKAKAAIRSALR